MKAECLAATAAQLGEGTTWHDDEHEVLWVDILRGEVHACDLAGQDRIIQHHAEPVGAVALAETGEVLVATPRGLCRADGACVRAIEVDGPTLRMNDGKPDPLGRYVGGTMTTGEAEPGAGSLWSIGDSPEPTRLLTGVTIPNGLAWSRDGTTLFWIDTPTRRIDAFDYDVATGTLADRRTIVEIDEAVGAPDGMTIDRDGGLWVALWGGAAVHRYLDGRLDEVVEVPTPFVTCPAFAGPALDRLVVTTASIEFDHPPSGAGDLYVADVGIVGVPANRLGSWASA